jgi:two-component system, OmpR family, sensor histidine kinase KdpD
MQRSPLSSRRGYASAIAAASVTTLVALPLHAHLDLTNIAMLFLLAVMLVAFRYGRGPAVAAAALNLLAFDFFFVPPRFSFAVADVQYLVTFAAMLAIGLTTAHLAEGLRHEAEVAGERERRSHDLYEMARALSGALTEEQIAEATMRFIEAGFGARAALLVRNRKGELWVPDAPGQSVLESAERAIAQQIFEKPEGALPSKAFGGFVYLPLKAPLRTRGVLIVMARDGMPIANPDQVRQLETFAVLIAIASERVHFVTVAREATVEMEGERLRNSVLASLSHDLRTPLTAILGSAETLLLDGRSFNAEQTEALDAIRGQARRTCELVENILDLARLESGAMRLRKEWNSIEEIVGSAIKSRETALKSHTLAVNLPVGLPFVECDAVLIERVLVNLLENAAKYTPAQSTITVSARVEKDCIRVDVADRGAGIAAGKEQVIFDKFVRGGEQRGIPGLGIGLAICRTIVEAHRGKIRVEAVPGGGADFVFELPLGTPPETPFDDQVLT